MELLLARGVGPRVAQRDPHTGVEKGELVEPRRQRVPGEVEDVAEAVRRGQEVDLRAAPGCGRRCGTQGFHEDAVGESDPVLQAPAPDARAQPRRQGVNHRGPHAVQAARRLVGVGVELAARVQFGEYQLNGGAALLLVHVAGDATAVIGDRQRTVRLDRHVHPRRVAGLGLVQRVVDDLVGHVVQARAIVGVADVHPRALSHRVESLEQADVAAVVYALALDGCARGGGIGQAIVSAGTVRGRKLPPPNSLVNTPGRAVNTHGRKAFPPRATRGVKSA